MRDVDYIPDPAQPELADPRSVFGLNWPEDPLLQRQYQRELDGWLRGMSRYRNVVERSADVGESLHLSPYRSLLEAWVKPLAEYITEIRFKYQGKRGTRPKWITPTKPLDATVLATVVMETILTRYTLGRPMKLTNLTQAIGKAIEWECHALVWAKKNPGLLKAYLKRLQDSGTTRSHRETVLWHGLRNKFAPQQKEKDGGKDPYEPWTQDRRVSVGRFMVLFAEMATGGRIFRDGEPKETMVGVKRVRKRDGVHVGGRPRKTPVIVKLDAETEEWIEKALIKKEITSIDHKPMCVPPLPWTRPTGGGYRLGIGPTVNVVRVENVSGRLVRDRLKEKPNGPHRVYQALNFLGNTKWKINTSVLDVALKAQEAGLDIPGLPQAHYLPEPPKPHDIEENEEARKEWRNSRARIIEKNFALRSRVMQAATALEDAKQFADDAAVYFPHSCDFRGRLYPMAQNGLNIQGPDLSRSLLKFCDGEPIETGEEAGYLAMYVAKNFAGNDKLDYDARMAWTFENEDLLRRIVGDPLGNREEWVARTDTRHRWLGMAGAQEWVRFLDHGFGFITTLPCFVDGTCNGIQHFAAMSRDEALADLVNLTDADLPHDIYQSVADRAFAIVQREAQDGDREAQSWARRWLRVLGSSAPRTLAKRAVMVRPYGGTMKSTMDYVGETLQDLDPHGLVFSEEERPKARGQMGKWMMEGLKGRLKSAEEVMAWLRETVHEVHDSGTKPGMYWTAPTGWPWAMAYGRIRWKNINVAYEGVQHQAMILEEDDTTIDIRRQKSGISPNFVHALDACALVYALNEMEDYGMSGVGVIHDSVGGLCTDIKAISQFIRSGFVHLYKETDILGSFHRAALDLIHEESRHLLPEPPEKGDLDIECVLTSRYFFN